MISPLSPMLARRLGNRTVISAGLALMGLGLIDLSTAEVGTGYPALALAVAIMGLGMGLVMAPASSVIMTTVPAHQASAGSAVNDTIREMGGSLGVAIVGSLAAAVYRNRLSVKLMAHHTPGAVVHIATGSIAAASAVAKSIGGLRGNEIVSAAQASYTTAMALGMRMAGAVAVAAALGTFAVIPRSRRGLAVETATAGLGLAPASSAA
jgi:DHA2 family multidrug resistance protein-like MFS transporter